MFKIWPVPQIKYRLIWIQNTSAIKRIEINRKLSFIPDDQIDQVKTFVDFLLFKSGKTSKTNTQNLHGIWKDKGFEKIVDLESELKTVRKQFSDSILNKKV